MALNTSQASFAARLSHLYGSIRNCFQPLSDLDQLEPELKKQTTADLGIDRHRLAELNERASGGAAEMEHLMQALHIDPVEVRIQSPSQFREMQLNCSRCSSKGECRQDLSTLTAPEKFASYCSNNASLNALRAEPDLLTE